MYRRTVTDFAVGVEETERLPLPLKNELAKARANGLAVALIAEAVEGLARSNQHYLRAMPSIPLLFSSGVKYHADRPSPGSSCGDDDWQDVLTTLHRQLGDCEDLAAWRIAELRERFAINACAVVTLDRVIIDRKKQDLYHILVQYPDGLPAYPPTVSRVRGMWIEDPSKILGM